MLFFLDNAFLVLYTFVEVISMDTLGERLNNRKETAQYFYVLER